MKKKFRLRRIISGILVILVAAFVFLKLTATKSEAAWFDDSWEYRKGISIASHTSTENNVYVTIPAFDATDTSRFQSDCGNLRFTDQNGKSLQFFAVDCDATANVNVLFDTLPAGSSTYYMYYGNLPAPDGFASANFPTAASNLGSQTAGSEEFTPGPISYWRFDEGSGNASDSTPQANTLTVTNAVRKAEEFCVSGKCLFFDGTTDYAAKTYSTDTELNPGTASFSVSMWFKHSSTVPGSNQFALARFLSGGYKIYMNTSGNMCFGIDSDATWTPSHAACNSTNLADSAWHHLTAVKSGTSTIALYIDGQQPVTVPITDSSSLSGSSPVFNVGIDTGQASGGWIGFLDEIKYYNFAKTAANVQTEFASRGSVKGVSASFGPDTNRSLSTGLAGYWKLDEASGNATDSSGNAMTGTATGTTVVGGQSGNARSFSGTDQLAVSTITSIQTVAFWIKPTNTTTDIIRFSTSPTTNITASSGVVSATGFTSPTVYVNGVLNGTLVTNIWQHVTAVSTAGITADGILLGRVSAALAGSLDDVRVYSRALTPAEVTALYNFAPGPMGWWKLDDNTGTTALDSSGNANSGTLFGGTSVGWRPGKLGTAVTLDGSDDLIEMADTNDFTTGQSFTVSAWIYRTSVAADSEIYSKKTSIASSTAGYTLFQFSSGNGGNTCAYVSDGGGVNQSEACTPAAATNTLRTWQHIAFTYDGSTRAVSVYLDGVDVTTDRVNAAAMGSPANAFCARIGGAARDGSCNGTSNGNNFAGMVDDVRIYNYGRTGNQVTEDMNAGHPVGGSPVGSQTLYYKFDEQNGTGAGSIHNSGTGSPTTANNTGAAWLLENNCKLNGCLNFDTTTDNVATTDPSFFDGIATMSATFWINPQTLTANAAIMSKSTTNQETFRIESWSTNTELKVTISNALTDTSNYYATQGLGLTASAWQHIAVVYNAGELNNADRVKVYRNGVKAGGGVTGTIPYGLRASTTNFRVGQSVGAVAALPMYMDEVKIYAGVALSPADVAVDMNAGSAAALGGVLGTHNNEGFAGNPPVAWLDFNEATGTTANDRSGTANTGTLRTSGAGIAKYRVGKIGSGVYLAAAGGDSDTVWGKVGFANDTFDALTAGTVEFWFKPDDNTEDSFQELFYDGAIDGGASNAIEIAFRSDTNQIELFSIGCVGDNITGTASIPGTVTDWHHLAFAVDSNGNKLYLDGTQAAITYTGSADATDTCFYDDVAETTTPADIGCTSTSSDNTTCNTSENYYGLIDEFKIYNYARSAAQVAYDYNRGAPSAWYKFDECQGTTAYDASGNSLNATISLGASPGIGDCQTASTAWGNGATGKYNSSLDFDGSDDVATVTNANAIDFDAGLQNGYTISAWINAGTAGESNVGQIFNKSANHYLRVDNPSGTSLDVEANFDLATTDANVNASAAITTGTWNHLVMTSNGSTTVTLYVNGIAKGTSTGSGARTADGNLLIGGATAANFDGLIDQFQIFPYQMTAGQIQRLYNEGSAQRFGPQTGSQ